MNDHWFYAQNNQQRGPVSLEALRQLLAGGQVHPASLVWTEGMPQWAPATSVPQLRPGHQPVVGGVPYAQPAGAGAGPYPPAQVHYGAADSYYAQQNRSAYVNYSGFWLRVGAALIDGIILFIPFFLLQTLLGLAAGAAGRGGRPEPMVVAIGSCGLTLVEIAVSWLYYALQESSSYQATLGKRAVGIRVTDLHGRRISFARATGRYFAEIISALTLGIGYLMAAFTEQKQALHDMIASTLVVRQD